MSVETKIINHKEFMLFEAGHSHIRAKQRASQIRKSGRQVRITPYEGKWAVWLRKLR